VPAPRPGRSSALRRHPRFPTSPPHSRRSGDQRCGDAATNLSSLVQSFPSTPEARHRAGTAGEGGARAAGAARRGASRSGFVPDGGGPLASKARIEKARAFAGPRAHQRRSGGHPRVLAAHADGPGGRSAPSAPGRHELELSEASIYASRCEGSAGLVVQASATLCAVMKVDRFCLRSPRRIAPCA